MKDTKQFGSQSCLTSWGRMAYVEKLCKGSSSQWESKQRTWWHTKTSHLWAQCQSELTPLLEIPVMRLLIEPLLDLAIVHSNFRQARLSCVSERYTPNFRQNFKINCSANFMQGFWKSLCFFFFWAFLVFSLDLIHAALELFIEA